MKHRQIGLLMIISGATLWGLSGPMIQWLFQHTNLSARDFLVFRLLSAGVLTLSFLVVSKKNIFQIWLHPSHWIKLLIFGTLGMLGAQYAFIETVYISNAVTATLFQFLGPVLITIYLAIYVKKLPTKVQFLAIIYSLIGVYLLITNGSTDNILLSRSAIIFGALTAIGFAFYTIQPKELITEWGTLLIIGWGMLIGGVALYVCSPDFSFQQAASSLTPPTTMMYLLIIVIGSLSFILYIGSLKYLSAMEAGLLSSIEPLVAAILSIIWLNESFGTYQLIGGVFIVASVVFLAIPEKKKKSISEIKQAS